jgi:chorismate mutase
MRGFGLAGSSPFFDPDQHAALPRRDLEELPGPAQDAVFAPAPSVHGRSGQVRQRSPFNGGDQMIAISRLFFGWSLAAAVLSPAAFTAVAQTQPLNAAANAGFRSRSAHPEREGAQSASAAGSNARSGATVRNGQDQQRGDRKGKDPKGEKTIEDWRRRIDEIDLELVRLLNERTKCAIEIGRIKKRLNLEITSPKREAQVLSNVATANRGPLDEEGIRRLFERIIEEVRRIEKIEAEKR